MQSIRDVLKTNLGRSLETLPPRDRLESAWVVACGRSMAGHGEIIAYADGVVTIAVDGSVWRAQMVSMQAVLERELARIAGVPVTAIHFIKRK